MAIDPDQAITEVKSMEHVVDASEGQRRSIMILLGCFAGLALILVIGGIYGVIAYSVARRTKELGIRQALGAHRRDILGLVLRQGLGLTLGGVAIGIPGALALTKLLKGLLFQVSATEPFDVCGHRSASNSCSARCKLHPGASGDAHRSDGGPSS